MAGVPNAGKSTLLNFICGEKVAIVTPKPQTTRNRILAIKTTKEAQVIFLDTPGLHESERALNKRMVKAANDSAREADVILFLFDPTRDSLQQETEWIEKLRRYNKPIIAAVNKVDAVTKESLLPIIGKLADDGIEHIHPISALTGDGVAELEKSIIEALPLGPLLYPEDTVTDQTERFLTAEIIREKIFMFTQMEIPYSTMVQIQEFKERSEKLSAVRAVIFVEKESQKGILIGSKAQMIKRIGTAARIDLEKRFDRKFHLDLSVKTKKDWTRDEAFLKKTDADTRGF